jgi:hypothetical protein
MADLKVAHHFVPDTTVEGMYRYLILRLAALKNLRIERPSPDTLVIHHRSSPGWTWIKMFETATVIGEDVKGGARFTATGQTSGKALVQIYRAFSLPGYGKVDPPPPTALPTESALDRVHELADLRDRGILTDQEFQVAKARLLDEFLGTDAP